MNKVFKVGGLFSGVGGLELGFLRNIENKINYKIPVNKDNPYPGTFSSNISSNNKKKKTRDL